MKKILSICCFLLCLHAVAQKDKNKSATPEIPLTVSGKLTVTKQSKALGTNRYESFTIIPKSKKSLRILANTSNANFQIQIKSKAKVYADQAVKNSFHFVLPLVSIDTVFVYFIANPTDTVNFQYSYVIFDTAQIALSKKADVAFNQLLNIAGAGFINLLPSSNSNAYNADLAFESGIFAPLRAIKDRRTFKQYTAMAVDEAAADKAIEDWNKKIKTWLKPKNVTDIKTLKGDELAKRSDYLLQQQATVYTKTNAQGQTMFTVYVYKSTDDGSSFYSGVAITN